MQTNTFFKQKLFKNELTELKTLKLKIKTLRGFPSIDQTQRNQIRRELLDGIYEQLFEELDEQGIGAVYNTEDGIAIEIANDDILDALPSSNGVVTLLVNISIPNLTYDSLDNLRLSDKTYSLEEDTNK